MIREIFRKYFKPMDLRLKIPLLPCKFERLSAATALIAIS
jgi:hypothetical protein